VKRRVEKNMNRKITLLTLCYSTGAYRVGVLLRRGQVQKNETKQAAN
jgi:hypothetical protein